MSKEIVGCNEEAHVPQHPELRLKNLALRGRGWKNNSMGLTTGAGDVYPLGEYELTWSGNSDVTISGASEVTSEPGRKVMNVTEYRPSGLSLRYLGSEPQDLQLSHLEYSDSQIFQDGFIDSLSKFDVWRVMDLTRTNGSVQGTWEDRPTLDDPIGEWITKGWPWELVIEAANQANVDLWICVPHAVDDDYVHKLGKLIQDNLNSNLKVYIEYSNECWNTGPAFDQSRWIANVLAKGVWRDRHREYGKRAEQIWNILKQYNFQQKTVLAGQAAQVRVLQEALEAIDSVPDVLSVAAYFNPGKEGLYDLYQQNPSKDAAFDLMRQSISKRKEWWDAHGLLAKEISAEMIAYEGGQHIAASAGTERNDAGYVKFLAEIQRDDRIIPIYETLKNVWREAGGKGLLYFQRLAGPTKFGSWGHQEFVNDDGPKQQSVLKHIEEAKVPDTDSNVIFESLDGTIGNVDGWNGQAASRFDGRAPVTFDLPFKLDPPFSVQFVFRRNGVGMPNGDKIGICETVRFESDEHKAFAACDVGEPKLEAVRSRHVDLSTPGDVKFIQNGSSKAKSGDVWFEDRWHYATIVFNSWSDARDLMAYLDDIGTYVQAPLPRDYVRAGFKTLTIGRCNKEGHVLDLSNIRVVKGIITAEQSIEDARALGLTYDRDPNVDPDPAPTPDPEPTPEPDPIVETGTYTKTIYPDREELVLKANE